MAGEGKEVLYHKEYENGHVTVYPDVLVARYTDENGVERLIIFRYYWFMTDLGGYTVDGPDDVLYIYTNGERIEDVEIVPHEYWERRETRND